NNVVIETTGLAEPGPVIQAFLSEPTLDGLYRIVNVITVVDAVNWEATATKYDEALRQVALADDLLISKLDLKGDASFATLSAELQAMNPAAKISRANFSAEAVAPLLMHKGFDAADPMADPSEWLSIATYDAYENKIADADGVKDQDVPSHLAAQGIESFVLTRSTPLAREELQFLLDGISQNLGPSLLRVKGLINILEEPGTPAVVQGVQHLLHTMTWLEKWPTKDERTRIVFITQGIARSALKDIIELLDRVCKRTFEARGRGHLVRERAENS
ncbi:MAG: GTP-binding protein, partial [Alphaproteobacteria bacterium]|nr:GTP-binding protein [Alphaproteobacteria bacterium]